MKKFGYILLFIWCAFTVFISPVILTEIFLYITGLIYQYDPAMEEGIAGIIGFMVLGVWIVAVVVPLCCLLKYARSLGRRKLFLCGGIMLFLVILCMALCGWDMVRFMTVPVNELPLWGKGKR